MAERITWDDDVKEFFTQLDVGCMRARGKGLDLSDYDSVKASKNEILARVKSGSMPKGGPRWPDEKVKSFEDWINDCCPRTQIDPGPPCP
jgi:hypothetical protein